MLFYNNFVTDQIGFLNILGFGYFEDLKNDNL